MAIYKGDTKVAGGNIKLDGFLSDTSNNPVPNQVITSALEEVGYSTWQKPADWIDIRSGALPNSVYYLVGHSADYSTYPTFTVNCNLSNTSNTYDVYVDGVKIATNTSGTTTTLTWQTLALASGWDVTYPAALRTHIVRVTPSVSTDTIASAPTAGTVDLGTLWVHLTLTNTVNINYFMGTNSNTSKRNKICEAVTAVGDTIKITANTKMNHSFRGVTALKTVPTIDLGGKSIEAVYTFYGCSNLKRIKIKNGKLFGNLFAAYCTELRSIDTENVVVDMGEYCYASDANLKTIMPISPVNLTSGTAVNSTPTVYLQGCTSLEPTFLDFSTHSEYKRVTLGGASTARIDGVKGMVVANDAPFNGTSPQIGVIYTGMTRAALVTLFNSLPTVTGSQVCNITGATGAADLTAEDLAIATNKGWTVTR